MEEKTRIEMDFVDSENEQEEEPKAMTEVKKTEEKPGFWKTVWNGVTFVPRWIGKKVKESPASAAIGMVAGAAVGYGTKAAIGHFAKKSHGDFIPADPIEVPEEDYASTSYSNDTTDE